MPTRDQLPSGDVIGIDVPIGCGPRQADAAARQYLKGSLAVRTVFTVPKCAQLRAPFTKGSGISKQAHQLGPRILHVAHLARSDPRLHEVHPEVSFRAMNGNTPLAYRKKSYGGVLERLELLRRHEIELGDLGEAAKCPIDDVLDAGAAAWSAHRIATGAAGSLPDPPQIVAGKPVAIWY